MYSCVDNKLVKSLQHYNENKSLERELIVNHLENHREVTTKTGLIRSLKYFYKDNVSYVEHNYTVFDSTPTSFVVNSRLESDQYNQFAKRFSDIEKNTTAFKEKMPQKHCEKNLWLLKPANEN